MISTVYIAVVCFALATLTVGAQNINSLHSKADFENLEEGLLSNHTVVFPKGVLNISKIAGFPTTGLKKTKDQQSSTNGVNKSGSNTDASKTEGSKIEVKKTEVPKTEDSMKLDSKPLSAGEYITTYKFGTFSSYLKEIGVPGNNPDIPGTASADSAYFNADVKYSGTVKVAFVRILVKQRGDVGSAVVTEGGIGTTSIKIHLQANKTNYLTYTAKFYSSGLVVKTGTIGNPTLQDVVLARVRGFQEYDNDTNARAVVNYPASFKYEGVKVTYVFVISKQTSDKLDVAVTKGEIAKATDNLQVTLKTGPTKLFIYEAVFYSSQAETMITYKFGNFSPYLKEIDVAENKPNTPGTPSADATYFNADVKYSGTVNVAFVRIFVKQTGDVGSAVVTEGAIGTTAIKIHLQANETNYFTYTAKFYSSFVASELVVKTGAIGKSTPKDVILARVQDTQQYDVDTNASAVVKYPGNIQYKGKKVTYVFVTSNQTSDNKLEVAVTKGELAKTTDNLEVTLKTDATKLLSYEVVFYSSGVRSQAFTITVVVALMVFLWNRVIKI